MTIYDKIHPTALKYKWTWEISSRVLLHLKLQNMFSDHYRIILEIKINNIL